MMKQYDIVIIGGGIHGAGAAQAAAAHGYSSLLLEQNDLASGTSSRSSKLIHGGLRYLESAQFSLVRECLRERELLLRLAPELVTLHPFNIPVYPDTQRRPWQLRAGLGLYATLGGLHASCRFRSLKKSLWQDLDGIDTQQLQAVFRYWDAQTDDVALTRAVMNSALELGAELCMPARFISADVHDKGCTVHYRKNADTFSCQTNIMINTAGPWVNQILENINPPTPRIEIDLVQGAHIIVDGHLSQGIYYLEAPRDKRVVFAMPWQEKILLGTTETLYLGDPSEVVPLEDEQDYLLETLAHYFPAYRDRDKSCILSSFAGLRVLPASNATVFSRPRDTILHADRETRPRILSIYGGKLTTYRATAEKVIQRLSSTLPARKIIANTRKLVLN